MCVRATIAPRSAEGRAGAAMRWHYRWAAAMRTSSSVSEGNEDDTSRAPHARTARPTSRYCGVPLELSMAAMARVRGVWAAAARPRCGKILCGVRQQDRGFNASVSLERNRSSSGADGSDGSAG